MQVCVRDRGRKRMQTDDVKTVCERKIEMNTDSVSTQTPSLE